MSTTRIDMRIDKSLKQAAEKAAALKGMGSLTEYVSRLIREDAEKVIKSHQSLTLENDVFDRFMDACEAADEPNQKLRDALKFAEDKGIN